MCVCVCCIELAYRVASFYCHFTVYRSNMSTTPPATSHCVRPSHRLLLLLQIFVEIERARLTRKLAAMREAEGNIAEAADILQEVAVVSSCFCDISV